MRHFAPALIRSPAAKTIIQMAKEQARLSYDFKDRPRWKTGPRQGGVPAGQRRSGL